MSRFLVVANASDDQIAQTIDAAGGEIVSALEPAVLIVDGEDGARQAVSALATVAAVSSLDEPLDVSGLDLDDDSAAAVDAWNGRFDPDLVALKQDFQPGDAWNAPGGSFVDFGGDGGII